MMITCKCGQRTKAKRYCSSCLSKMLKKGLKYCPACNKVKKLKLFAKNRWHFDGFNSNCRRCCSKRSIRWYNKIKETPHYKKYRIKQQKRLRKAGYYKFGTGATIVLNNRNASKGFTDRITRGQLKIWWKKTSNKCYYCDINTKTYIRIKRFIINYKGNDRGITRFKRAFFGPTVRKINQLTIDRKIDSIGYNLNNMVKACWLCNHIKGTYLFPSDMKLIAPRIMGRLIKRIKAAGGKI